MNVKAFENREQREREYLFLLGYLSAEIRGNATTAMALADTARPARTVHAYRSHTKAVILVAALVALAHATSAEPRAALRDQLAVEGRLAVLHLAFA